MKIIHRHGPENFDPRMNEGDRLVRETIRRVPLLQIVGWQGAVMLGEFGFDGCTAGISHLTDDYRPETPTGPAVGGRIDVVTRLTEHGTFIPFPWDDHSRGPRPTPPPTGRLPIDLDGQDLAGDTWYRNQDWVSATTHPPFSTVITGRGIPLASLELATTDEIEPLLATRRVVIRSWALPLH